MNNIIYCTICIVPSLIILWYIYIKERNTKEPKNLLLCLFIGGIIAAVISALLEVSIESKLPILKYDYKYLNPIEVIFKSLIIIALIEESSKWLINYSISWNNNNFDHLYDSIMYGAYVSLGFATYENICYAISYSSYGFFPIFLRGLTSVPCHAVFGIIMGYFLSKAKLNRKKKKLYIKYLIFSYLSPILLHFIYNILIGYNNKITFVPFLIYIIILYTFAYNKINKMSKSKKILN